MNSRESQPFRGISMIFSVIPGNPSEMEFWYQEKVSVAGRVSGNEQLSSNSGETRGECKLITAARISKIWGHPKFSVVPQLSPPALSD
jgi:hypothetical protein